MTWYQSKDLVNENERVLRIEKPTLHNRSINIQRWINVLKIGTTFTLWASLASYEPCIYNIFNHSNWIKLVIFITKMTFCDIVLYVIPKGYQNILIQLEIGISASMKQEDSWVQSKLNQSLRNLLLNILIKVIGLQTLKSSWRIKVSEMRRNVKSWESVVLPGNIDEDK